MADVAGLGIKIDSSEAKKGAQEVIRAMEGILAEAKKVTAGVDSTGQSFEKLKKGGGILQTLRDHWMALSIAAYAAFQVIKTGWDRLLAEGKEQAMERGLDRLLAKYKITSTEIMRELQRASNGIISRDQALEISARGLAIGLDPTSLVDYAEKVERVSQIMGADFVDSMKAIETAAQTGMARPIRAMLGLMPDFTQAIKEHAIASGLAVDQMTEEELTSVRMATVLAELKKKYDLLPPTMDSVYLRQQRMKASWEDMKDTIDGKLLAAVTRIYGITDKWGALLVAVTAGGVAFFAIKAALAAVEAYKMAAGLAAVDAVLKVLHITMLKNPIFWIATVLGLAAAAWYQHSEKVKETQKVQEDYYGSLKTMSADRLAEEKLNLETRIAGYDEEIAKLKEIRAEQDKRAPKIIPQGRVKGTGMEWSMQPIDTSWLYQSKEDLEEALSLRKGYSDALAAIKKREADEAETEEKTKRAARAEDIQAAEKSITEMALKSAVDRANTEAEYTGAKTKEMEAKYKLTFGELSDAHRALFLDVVSREWREMVEKANAEAVAETKAAARQMASDMDSALFRAGKLDEGESISRKYARDTDALKDALAEQQRIRDAAGTAPADRIKAEAKIGSIRQQIAQKPQEQALDEIALANKTEDSKRAIAISAAKDQSAAIERINQERVQAGEMTELDALASRYDMQRKVIDLAIEDAEQVQFRSGNLEEVKAKEAEINRLLLERRTLDQIQPYETERVALARKFAESAAKEAEIKSGIAKIDMQQALLEKTPSEAALDRIPMLKEQLALQEENLAALQRRTPEEKLAWQSQSDAVEATNQKLREQKKLLQDRTAWAGMKAALVDYAEDATNWGAQMNELTTTIFQGMEDELVSFFRKGKFEFRSFIDSVLDDLARIAVQQAITGPLSKAFLGAFGGGGGITQGEFDALWSAKGNAFDQYSNVIPFRKGGVVDKPSMFRFAKGVGMMSEDEPEAIMPLARLPSGDLGVRAAGGGGSQTINVTVPISIVDGQASVGGPAGGGVTPEVARALSVMIRSRVVEVIQEQRRAGGLLGG